ncbi:hypothetical protein BV898_05615 [Hypsibius exemplaris]|uniref:F5/8 type C domain-containing protein n=1 Tax=Hypsibius exemplaris TaxID=2072580 RepID=A0A1W0WYP6_HYPEX|nr:hypothetical protein BV898_05615 [Hypsibius exemplaris]
MQILSAAVERRALHESGREGLQRARTEADATDGHAPANAEGSSTNRHAGPPTDPMACGQVPVSEIKFHEIDYGKKALDLKTDPDIQGKGYVNLRLLAQDKSTQNHNNHIALEVDLGRQRRLEQLLFKGSLQEGLPAILRAFYVQFLDREGSQEWRWLSHAGKPTPFIVTQIPVLNQEQVQTVFSVRFSQSLITDKIRIYPELWQKLPLIRMAVVACG